MAASVESGPPAESQGRIPAAWQFGVTGAVGLLVFLIAYDDGSYSLESRNTLAIAAWWGVILLVLSRPSASWARPPALVTGGLLLLFTAWTGISAAWSDDVERTVAELDRTALYLGVFVLVVLLIGRGLLSPILDGIALGLIATAALALTSRFLPGIASLPEDTARRLPAATIRLSYPVAYWNGLGILVALAAPLLLRSASLSRSLPTRALAVAGLPLVATTIDLTASRGAAAVAALAAVVFIALSPRRWSALAAVTAGTAGSLVAVEGIHLIANEDAAVAAGQGGAAAIVIGACLLTGVAYAAWDVLLARRFAPAPVIGWALTGVAVVAVLGVVVASHPVRRFEDFKQPQSAGEGADNVIRTSFGEASGSGRWQYWSVAWDEFRAAPGKGGSAGSYERWWAEHGSLPRQIRDAHSLYLETLAELGVIGFLLLGGVFVTACVVGASRIRRAPPGERTTLAAALACFLAFAVAAGIDWMWELPVVTLVGVACLAALVSAPHGTERARVRSRLRLAAVATVCCAVALAVIAVEAVLLLAQLEVERSRAAVRRGDTSGALARALDAQHIAPWASSPYLQLALVNEQRGDLASARSWIRHALARDSEDWRLWLVSARIETEAGRIPAARRSLQRARELNPRSTVFSSA
jgi:O-antigen ligase/polysaccharide polymerase Wzy-like membrane protein